MTFTSGQRIRTTIDTPTHCGDIPLPVGSAGTIYAIHSDGKKFVVVLDDDPNQMARAYATDELEVQNDPTPPPPKKG